MVKRKHTLSHRTRFALLTVVGLTALSIAPVAQASVLYREVFGWDTDTGVTSAQATDFTHAGWNHYQDVGATTPSGGMISDTGQPANLFAVNSTTDAAGTGTNRDAKGLANWKYGGPDHTTAYQYLYYTTEYTITRPTAANDADLTLSAYLGLSAPADGDSRDYRPRFAVRIGSQWYVSDALLTAGVVDSTSHFDTDALQASLTLGDAGGFHALTVTPATGSDATLTIGNTAAALPGGDISGFGLLAIQTQSTRFTFDTFTVTAVPEPSTAALLALAGVPLVLGRRRTARRWAA